MSAPDPKHKSILFSHHHYQILEPIKAAGMAEVFLAFREEDGLLVALKRLRATLSNAEDFLAMFADEAQLMSRFSHPNIPAFYDYGRDEKGPLFTMEHIEGCDLSALPRRLPHGLSAYVAARVAGALSYAHTLRDPEGVWLEIIHRDVCPENVMISTRGEVKLIDFGIARNKQQRHHTQPGIIKGKFGYMSPEMVRGLSLDFRHDIFVLGALLYELIAGKKLFQAESDFQTLELVRVAEVPSLRELRPDLPEALERITRKCLARRPEERYQQTSDLEAELRALADALIPPRQQATTLAQLLIK